MRDAQEYEWQAPLVASTTNAPPTTIHLHFIEMNGEAWPVVYRGDCFSWFAALLAARLSGYQGA